MSKAKCQRGEGSTRRVSPKPVFDPACARPFVAGLLSVPMAGLGQMVFGRGTRGALFALIEVLFCVLYFRVLALPLARLGTLGTRPGVDDSRQILLAGILAAMVALMYGSFHVYNVLDAARGARGQRQASRRVRLRSFGAVSPYLYTAPAFAGATLVILVPLVFGICLAFTNYNLYHSPPANLFSWVGFENFKRILSPLSPWRAEFLRVFVWNITWAVLGTTLAFGVGLGIALALLNPGVRWRSLFRAILMLPWAIPATVSIMTFSGLFNTTFGPVNQILKSIGLRAIPWFQDPFWAKIAVLLTYVWVGFPFNMAVSSAALQSIPTELYEAARVDGASAWDCFARITFPLLFRVVAPVLVLSFAGNFNNFSIIYLLTGGGPAVPSSRGSGATDILITWVYNLGFQQLQWSYASALAVIIFLIVVGMSMLNFRLSGAIMQLQGEGEQDG